MVISHFVQSLQEPRQVCACISCLADAFVVLVDVSDIPPDANRLSAGNDHVLAEQEIAQRIERVGRTIPPLCNDCSPPFALEKPVVCHRYEANPINKCLHFRSHVGEIDWGAQNNPVSYGHLFDAVVYNIVIEHAAPVFVFNALHASGAPADILTRKLNQFGTNVFVFEFLKHDPDQNGSVAVLSWASVDSDNLCYLYLSPRPWHCGVPVCDFSTGFTRHSKVIT